MGIKCARLKEYDFKAGNLMKSFTTSKGTKFVAGIGNKPSPIRILKSSREIAELSEYPQFEILEFANMDELNEHVQREMEARVYEGKAPVRARIEGVKPAAKTKEEIDKITSPTSTRPQSMAPKSSEPTSTKKTGRGGGKQQTTKKAPTKKKTTKKPGGGKKKTGKGKAKK